MTEPSEKDRANQWDATVFLRHNNNGMCSLTPCSRCSALAEKFAAIRAEEAARIAKDAAANMEFLGVPEQSAEIERLRAERDEANGLLLDSPVKCDCHPGVRWTVEMWDERCPLTAALARAEAAEAKLAECERERDALRAGVVKLHRALAGLMTGPEHGKDYPAALDVLAATADLVQPSTLAQEPPR